MNNKNYNKISIARKIITISAITILTSAALTSCNAINRTSVGEHVDITYWEPDTTTLSSDALVTEPSEQTTPMQTEPEITTTTPTETTTTQTTPEEITEQTESLPPAPPTPPNPEEKPPEPPKPPAPPEPEVTEPIVTEATTTVEQTPSQPDDTAVLTIINTATAQIGIPFVQGGDSAGGFDNSGLLYYVGKTVNSEFPRNIGEQIAFADAVSVSYEQLMPGDFVYFSGTQGGRASYGGIYIGDGYMIYASNPGTLIEKKNISTPYWKNHFACAIRIA